MDPRIFADIPARIARYGDRFRVFEIGFSLWERAWTLRGLENMYADLLDHPRFARELLEAIAEWNLAQVRKALRYDIDGVYFGDDWGQQHGLQIGPRLWREFLRPPLERMFAEVKRAGRFVVVHSCGDVQELFDELIGMGLDCFNPFQPEVMDVFALLERYRGRLSFFGGLSTQRTLPYGSPEEVRRETRRLLAAGRGGRLPVRPRARRGGGRAAGQHAGLHRGGSPDQAALTATARTRSPRAMTCSMSPVGGRMSPTFTMTCPAKARTMRSPKSAIWPAGRPMVSSPAGTPQ